MKIHLWILFSVCLLSGSGMIYSDVSNAPEPAPSLEHFDVPESLGKVDERFIGSSDRWVINIQDVHAHPVAQENIAAILEHLQSVYDVSAVALEGGWHRTTLPRSRKLPNSREKQQLARALLEDGLLTGPGYAALFAPKPLRLFGAEDPRLYEENRAVYLRHHSEIPAIEGKWEKAFDSLLAGKDAVFSGDARAFEESLLSFRQGEKIDTFLPDLVHWADRLGLDLEPLDQIAFFSRILELSASIHKEKLELETKRLQSAYAKKKLHFEELLRSGEIPAEALEHYPEVQKLSEIFHLQDLIRHALFMDQIEILIRDIKTKLLATPEAQAWDQRMEGLLTAHKILRLEATPRDIQYQEAHAELMAEPVREAGLADDFARALMFYDYAKKRDDIFFQAVTDPRSPRGMAIVAGGFHTEGLREKLHAAGISYIVITPDLGGQATDPAIYLRCMQLSPAPEQHALVYPLVYLLERFDESFANTIAQMKTHVLQSLQAAIEQIKNILTGNVPAAAFRAEEKTPSPPSRFLALSTDEQKTMIQQLLENIPPQNTHRVFALNRDTLARILEKPEGRAAWTKIISNRLYTIFLVVASMTDVPAEALGGTRAKIEPVVLKDLDLNSALKQPRFLRKYGLAVKHDAAVITPENYSVQNPDILPVRESPLAPLVAELLLMSPDLRASFQSAPAQTQALIESLLASLESFQTLLQSA